MSECLEYTALRHGILSCSSLFPSLPTHPRYPPLSNAYLKEDAPFSTAFREARQAGNIIQVMLQLDPAFPQKVGVESPEPFLDRQTAGEARKGPTKGFVKGGKVVEASDDGPGLLSEGDEDGVADEACLACCVEERRDGEWGGEGGEVSDWRGRGKRESKGREGKQRARHACAARLMLTLVVLDNNGLHALLCFGRVSLASSGNC